MEYTVHDPWIPEREATVCMWKPDYNRGYISNMNTSLLVDVVNFSQRQLREYVRMLQVCGFTGIQLTDICAAWRASGSWERVHDCFKMMADAAHENGMKVTLWVWAAELSGHGWHDSDAVYRAADGAYAYDDPQVFAFFNKYYEIYADMAPYCDRVIAHFYDPGRLERFEDIVSFAKLLENKCRSRNPNIRMAVDTWNSPDNFPQRLADAGLQSWMLMEGSFLPSWQGAGKRAEFRESVRRAGCELGIWGWYTAEYEIDQRASMYVNAKVLKDVYRQIRAQGDHVMRPSYYSEMDSYHVLNVFSLYCAGHLLIDPDADEEELLRQIAELVAGTQDRDVLLDALHLIQDARSGDRWGTYWWTEADYVLGSKDAVSIRDRATVCLQTLEAVVTKKKPANTIPLPIEGWQLMKLMLPHLAQIRKYAQFRIDMAELERLYAGGADRESLAKRLDEIWEPVPEYNCIVGLWGIPEAQMQTRAVRAFCKMAGLSVPRRGLRDDTICKRIYEHLCVIQRGNSEPVYISPYFYEGGIPFEKEEYDLLIGKMVQDGLLLRHENGNICLRDWEMFRYDFNC